MDFGSVNTYTKDNSGRLNVNFYLAPECYDGNFLPESDIWSCGIILYIMICGYPPFFGNNESEMREKVEQCRISFEGDEWNKVDPMVKDLILGILKINPQERMIPGDILMSEWVVNN